MKRVSFDLFACPVFFEKIHQIFCVLRDRDEMVRIESVLGQFVDGSLSPAYEDEYERFGQELFENSDCIDSCFFVDDSFLISGHVGDHDDFYFRICEHFLIIFQPLLEFCGGEQLEHECGGADVFELVPDAFSFLGFVVDPEYEADDVGGQLLSGQLFYFIAGDDSFVEFVLDVGDGEDFEIDVGFEKDFVFLLVEGELFDAVA